MGHRSVLLLEMVLGLSLSTPLFAHHGGTTIYNDETVRLEGTVKVWYWSNPHVLLSITVAGDDGEAADWIFELQAPNTVRPLGFRPDLLAAGDKVTVEFQPAKNGNRNGRLTRLVLADGTDLDPRSFNTRRGDY